jgi:hypothetical protein
MSSSRLLILAGFLSTLGCGKAEKGDFSVGRQAEPAPAVKGKMYSPVEGSVIALAPAEEHGPQQDAAAPIARKIIYTATMELLVEDLPEASAQLNELVQRHQGIVAQSDTTNSPGAPRSGSWRLRIPVDVFDNFLTSVVQLGQVLKNKRDSEDITDKYYDHQIRIANKQIQVERLQKIIKEQTGKITELLEAEKELGRVTTELEQFRSC